MGRRDGNREPPLPVQVVGQFEMWQLIRLTLSRWGGQQQSTIDRLPQAKSGLDVPTQIGDHNLLIFTPFGPTQVRFADSVMLTTPFVNPNAGATS